jgi:predicted MFS family arabinose efflux permease
MVPLKRNRDFVLLQVGQALSAVGSQATAVAYPLLTLAVTGSAWKAGVAGFAAALPTPLVALPAGVAADRWGRRRLMIGADIVRAGLLAVLAGAILRGQVRFGLIVAVAFAEGVASTLFRAAEAGALRSVVPVEQLATAVATQTGRYAAVRLTGPPLGGALFGIARWLPFGTDAVSYAASTVALLSMRTPFEEQREPDPAGVYQRLREGVTFVANVPFLRTTSLIFGLGNFVVPGLLLSLVVISEREGLSAAEIGALVAVFGAAIALGSTISGAVRARLSVRAIIVLEGWLWPMCALFLIWPSAYVLAATLVPVGLVLASTDSVVHGTKFAITPDRLIGRVHAVQSTLSFAIAPLGSLAAGWLLGISSRAAIATFAAVAVLLAFWSTVSPAVRSARPIGELQVLA